MGYKWDLFNFSQAKFHEISMKNKFWVNSLISPSRKSQFYPTKEWKRALTRWRNHQQNVRIQKLQMVNQHTLFNQRIGLESHQKMWGFYQIFHQPEFTWLTSNQAKMCRFFSNQRPTQRHDVPTCSRRPLLICLLTGFFCHQPIGVVFSHWENVFYCQNEKNLSSCLFSNCASSNFGG